ncbi:Acetyltransferase (GNAT) family protein [Cnuella takakiae]|uniref:Acetyltransferase (GNAT) family protein n=1 Tax=Cnuella takakiae TaxID=1302690 RepID=A0A1M5F267_9BACT|nr:GNAT family N-acetyltransferase [Cnuella takakiae]OLY90944.1 GNAT family N-acetyltransferase [Cnuella takakiae]SHF85565.1 Acetyltransferase (GNAT) family protein [Cnuella takakiae]
MQIQRLTTSSKHLVTDLFNQYRVFYKQPSDPVLADAYISNRLQYGESVIFVALNDAGEPVGFTQLYSTWSSVRAVKNWILNDLYVTAAARRLGAGRKLIDAALAFARTEGAGYVQLETAEDNHNARRLYETIGFVQQAPETEYLVYRISL